MNADAWRCRFVFICIDVAASKIFLGLTTNGQMIMRLCLSAVAVVLTGSISEVAMAQENLPKGWGGGIAPYEAKLDRETKHGGEASLSLSRSAEGGRQNSGTILQAFEAKQFVGKRIRYSGFVKASDVVESAGLWLRVDSSEMKPVVFDNMQTRPIQGTTEWVEYQIVVDIPENSANITIGALLTGTGKIWVDDLAIAEVGKDVEVTAEPFSQRILPKRKFPGEPTNLDFEH